MNEVQNPSAPVRREFKTSDFKKHLNDGLTRDEIRVMYGLTHAELKAIFSTPSLKGAKTKKSVAGITIVDDLSAANVAATATATTTTTTTDTPVAEEAPVAESNTQAQEFVAEEIVEEVVVEEVAERAPFDR